MRALSCVPVLVAAGLALAACNDSDDGAMGAEVLKAEFSARDKFDQEVSAFTAGEAIAFVFTVTNTGNSTITYALSRPGHDILVMDGDTTIWSKFHGRFFPQIVTSGSIGPGEVLDLGASWQGVDTEGNAVPPGTYEVVPHLTFRIGTEKVAVPEPVTITIN